TRTRGVLIGVSMSVVIAAAIYPFRHYDYELELLLVLPVVFTGVLAGRTAALATAVVAVLAFHIVTRSGSSKVQEDAIAFVAFLGSALFVGAAIGGGADRLTMARQREQEQRQLQELNAQIAEDATKMAVLQQVDQQRVALLRSVSHDLRTPLATIRAVATDLRDSNLHDEQTRQELLKSVSDEAERLDRLVGNLLSMSRIEAGSMRIEDQVVDLTELLQLTVIRLGPLFPQVEVEVHIDPALPLINGDPVLLDEVVSNLLENAARYAPVGSTVLVDLKTNDGPTVTLLVCDHGPGIDPALVDHVFQAFWRGPDSHSSGLGLAIARAIVEAHGGTIRVAASPGGGATFEVRLPAREDAML
ncbi:MAG TPA: ATP-binding protein, partial [Ilumatobacteraceae bacterium]|nr:ATP-binding protein [Ilumatobacteraceae bacterium]